MINKITNVFLSIKINYCFNFIINSLNKKCRINNKHMKNRNNSKYSNRKIRSQKGTGFSRLSDKSNPILKGGSRSFSNIKTNNKKLNKKNLKLFIKKLFLSFIYENNFFIISFNKIKLNKINSRNILLLFKKKYIYFNNKTLLVLNFYEKNFYLSIRNIDKIFISKNFIINPLKMNSFKSIVFIYK
ncbi:50S ribosomal protein L4 [Candidatus Vidania fulgoroideorum]